MDNRGDGKGGPAVSGPPSQARRYSASPRRGGGGAGAGRSGEQVNAAIAERLAALKAKNAAMNRQAADSKLRGARNLRAAAAESLLFPASAALDAERVLASRGLEEPRLSGPAPSIPFRAGPGSPQSRTGGALPAASCAALQTHPQRSTKGPAPASASRAGRRFSEH